MYCSVLTIFIAGLSGSSAPNTPVQSGVTGAVTPAASSGPLYSAGDILKNPKSSAGVGILIVSDDATTDTYKRALIYPNSDGSWGYRVDSRTENVGRATIEKVYTVKVTNIAVSAIPIGTPVTTSTPVPVATTESSTAVTTTATTSSTAAPGVTGITPNTGYTGTSVCGHRNQWLQFPYRCNGTTGKIRESEYRSDQRNRCFGKRYYLHVCHTLERERRCMGRAGDQPGRVCGKLCERISCPVKYHRG